ncbi:MAG: hypothetical protein ACU0DW_08525, partial [Shimia sp.]
MADTLYAYQATGRNRATAIGFGIVWALIAILWLALDAHPLILGLLALVSLPAGLDLLRAPEAHFWITETELGFDVPGQSARLAHADIEKLTADTRLDLSLRLTAWLTTGEK